jgi:hypothetical protein
MNELSPRTCAKLLLVTFSTACAAQAKQPTGTLTIAGQSDQVQTVRINGKSYVDIESLARVLHGSIRFQGGQTILTLPGAEPTAGPAALSVKAPQLSAAYLSAEIEALTQIREWHARLANAIQNNAPVTDTIISPLRRAAESKLQLAVAATSTDPDQQAVALLRDEYSAMQQESDQFVAAQVQANYTAPDSLDNNPLDKKIQSCQQALVSMAATKQFQDEASCH